MSSNKRQMSSNCVPELHERSFYKYFGHISHYGAKPTVHFLSAVCMGVECFIEQQLLRQT